MKQQKRINFLRLKAPWLTPTIKLVEERLPQVLHKVPADGDSDRVTFAPGRKFMAGTGPIPRHTDPLFGPYLYLLILKADDAVLEAEGYAPLPLHARMLVELNVRKTHCVSQPMNSTLVWHHVETKKPTGLEEVLATARAQLTRMKVTK